MCGIAGVIGMGQEAPVEPMCRLLRHRGPDDQGAYSDSAAALGMVRLSIIDVAGGHQPMTDERQRYQLVFNGEIYNYRALRQGLLAKGHRLSTRSDTEVIVHLYEEEQERCLQRLNGDFGIAVWDREAQRLFLARDRFGVKPLYYWHQGSQFAFASELKALLSLPAVSRELDLEALDAYLAFLYIPAPQTIFKSIKKLPPGHWLTFSRGEVRLERYWRLPLPPPGVANAPERSILEKLRESVQCRMVSDVPLGAFLSGGIDSSAVVALMREATTAPVETFSIGFEPPDDTYNELPSARLAARAFGTRHHEFVVKPNIAELLPQAVWHLDEPFADSSALLTFLISREARRHVTVALTGIGGDELFGGYPRYLGAWASMHAARLPRLVRDGLSAAVGWLPESPTSSNTPGRLKRFVDGLRQPEADRYLSWISQMPPAARAALYTTGMKAQLHGRDAWAAFRRLMSDGGAGYVDRVNALDLQTYLPDDLLAMGDKMSMAHGLEIRVPFCDHHLAEAAAAIPMRQRLRGFRLKGLLKSSLKGILPDALLGKPKQGFMLPLASWLRGPLAPMTQEALSPARLRRRGWLRPEAVSQLIARQRAGEANLSHRVYALIVLELWCQRYLDHGL